MTTTAYTHVACPSCRTRLRAEDMSLETMTGKCQLCHALVDLRSVMPGTATVPAMAIAHPPMDTPAPAGGESMPVPLPARMVVDARGSDLTIVMRWFSWTYIFMAFFCVVWDGFLVFWYGMALASQNLVMMLFPLLHVAVGVGLTYFTVAGFFNRTTFRVERGYLSVRHGPLPWPGNLEVPTSSLEQLFCTEKVSHGRNGTTVRYGVEAVLKDGRHLKLAPGLEDREQAMFLEQTIEKHLGIQDRRVRSEMVY
jgi:hypothetical protein